MSEQSKSLKIFAKVGNVSQGTLDVLRLIGETSPRSISEWKKTAELVNAKPGNISWENWKKIHTIKKEKVQTEKVDDHKSKKEKTSKK